MKKKIIIVCCLVIFLLLFGTCVHQCSRAKIATKALKQTEAQVQSFETLQVEFDEQMQLVAQQEQVLLSKELANETLLVEKEELKKLNLKLLESKTELEAEINRENLKAPFIDTVYIYRDRFHKNYIQIPLAFEYTDEWTSLYGYVMEEGVLIQELKCNTGKISTYIGEQKLGLFKKAKPMVSVKFECPYIEVQALDNVIIKEPPKWYQTKLFNIGTGVAIGMILTKSM